MLALIDGLALTDADFEDDTEADIEPADGDALTDELILAETLADFDADTLAEILGEAETEELIDGLALIDAD